MLRVLITGGAGYIGSVVNRYLLSQYRHIETIVLDSFVNGHKDALPYDQIYYEGDCRDVKLLDKIFSETKIDVVIHLAAYASVPDSVVDPLKYYDNNLTSTLYLLETMDRYDVNYLVFSSSAAVYGDKDHILSEDDEKNPINPYGRTKLMCEQIIEDYAKARPNFRYCNFRYFCAAGAYIDNSVMTGEAHKPECHIIPTFIKKTLIGEPMHIYGDKYPTPDGSCIRDFINVNDIALAHYLAIQRFRNFPKAESLTLNLGESCGYSVKQMADFIGGFLPDCHPSSVIDEPRQGDPGYLIADASKALKELHWYPRYTVQETIQQAIDWELNRTY